MRHPDRRDVLGLVAGAGLAVAGLPSPAAAAPDLLMRAVPSTGERLPAVGLGTWITFNVGEDRQARAACTDVMRAFFEAGGRMIDSSPMYGSSQPVVGEGLAALRMPGALFSAEKVWTWSGSSGPGQIEESRRHWGVPRFDLLQVHNLLAWEDHIETLKAMKAEGRVRHIGITTSEGRRHDLFEEVMRSQPLDFVQVSYNALDRAVESRILPLAQERGIAVIVNRPFRQRALIAHVERHPLPGFAAELGCRAWAQVLLKFVLAHPAVTCAIPATTQVEHVRENLEACTGPQADEAMRARIADHVASL